MTRQEFTKRVNELTANVRNSYTELHQLLNNDFQKDWESENGLETYHAIMNALYDFYLNGAQLVDDYTRTDIGSNRSCVYKSRNILKQKHI